MRWTSCGRQSAGGEFDRARARVGELAGTTPDSPQVAEATSRIDRVEAAAHHAEQMVLAAIRAGEFEQARAHVQQELARATPLSASDLRIGDGNRAGAGSGAACGTTGAGGHRPG